MSNWDTKKLFANVPYRVVDTDGPIRSILFENEPYLGRPTKVFAYLGIPPTADRPLPGMVCVHGGGGKAFKKWVATWVARGYAAIAMDLSGHDASGRRLVNGGPEQDHPCIFSTTADWADLWTYHAVAAVIRSHSVLRALAGVDPAHIGITGISWGGYLTCIVAGVDKRFACAIPVYGCGFLQHNSADAWMKIFADMTPAQRRAWHAKCDPSVYMRDIAAPLLFVSGTNDFAYPLDSVKMSYQLPRAPVALCIRVGMQHGHEAGWAPREIRIFADQHLRGCAPLPEIGACQIEAKRVSAKFTVGRRTEKAMLLYTTQRGRWQDRMWNAAPARLVDGCVRAELPENVAACYLAIEDDRGAYVSSAHIEIEAGPAKPQDSGNTWPRACSKETKK